MKKSIVAILLAAILISACSANAPTPTAAPQAIQATATALPPTATATAVPSPLPPTATTAPTATATPAPSLFPDATFTANVSCRMGPDKNYYRVVDFKSGQTSQVHGRSDDSLWLNITTGAANKSFSCWVPVSSVKPVDGLASLRVVTAIPLPTGASSASVRERPYCGVNKPQGSVVIDWSPYAEGTGFIIYRNGVNIANVYAGEYIDHDTPGSKTAYTLNYTIQAFNSVGVSKVTASVSITICD